MFICKREVDKLNTRNAELARQLRDVKQENKELKEIRKTEVRNNTLILKVNTAQSKLINEIEKELTSNAYGNEKAKIDKIKELVHDYQSNKLTQIKNKNFI